MEYKLYDLICGEFNKNNDLTEIFERNYINYVENENELKLGLNDKQKQLLSHVKLNVINSLDDAWFEKVNYFIHCAVLVGMDIQKFIDSLEM